MSNLNFPTNPSPGDTWTVGNKTYRWTGLAWVVTTTNSFTSTNLSSNLSLVTSSTNSTSTTSGALVVTGGVGIGQDLYVGGNIYGNIVGAVSTASAVETVASLSTLSHYLTFVDSNNLPKQAEDFYTTSSVYTLPNSGQLWATQLRQTSDTVAIGGLSGGNNQGQFGVALGYNSGGNQGQFGVAIGASSGGSQGYGALAIGVSAGQTGQNVYGIAIGGAAAQTNQQLHGIAIGYAAAQQTQSTGSVAIGFYSGNEYQNNYAIAIGYEAGKINQGANSIAIGRAAGTSTQTSNSIILNASGTALGAADSGFYVSPIRNDQATALPTYLLVDNASTKEISTSSYLQFIPSTGVLTLASSVESTSTTTGALVVSGGIGAGGNIWAEGRVTSESIKILDTVFDSTKITLTPLDGNGNQTIDTYSLTEYRAAKYFIQISKGIGTSSTFQAQEITLIASNTSTVDISVYGKVTTNGPTGLGTFTAAVISTTTVQLIFTPDYADDYVIKVLRTAMTS